MIINSRSTKNNGNESSVRHSSTSRADSLVGGIAGLSVFFASYAGYAKASQQSSGEPASALTTSAPQSAETNPFMLPYRVIATQPDFKIPLVFETVPGLPTEYSIAMVRNAPLGSTSSTTTLPASGDSDSPFSANAEYYYTPKFFLQERTKPLARDGKDPTIDHLREIAPSIVFNVKRDPVSKLVSITFGFDNSFKALRETTQQIVAFKDIDSSSKDGINAIQHTTDVLPVTDAFMRIVTNEGQVLATGYTNGIFGQRGPQSFTVLFTEENFKEFALRHPQHECDLIWYYRYSNVGGSYFEAMQDVTVDISNEINALRQLDGAEAQAPILVGQVDSFRRAVEGKLQGAFRANDPALAGLAAQLASDQVISQAFTMEQTRSAADFAQEYPQIMNAIGAYLLPHIEQIIKSRGTQNAEVNTHTETTTQSVGASGGVNIGVASFGISGGLTRTEVDQLQKSSGVTLQETSRKDIWEIKSITFRHAIKGVQKVNVSGKQNGLVIQPPNAGYVTAPPLPSTFTIQVASQQLIEHLKAQKDRNGQLAVRNQIREKCESERTELDQLQKELGVSPSQSDASKLARYLAVQEIGPAQSDQRIAAEITFYCEQRSEHRKEINHLRQIRYDLQATKYKEDKKVYDAKVAEINELRKILDQRHQIDAVGRDDAPKEKYGQWITLQEDRHRRWDKEQHFAGGVTYFGKRPDNMAMLIREVGGDIRESGKLMPQNEGGTRRERKLSGAKDVINGIHSFYQGNDSDGYYFTTTSGLLDCHLGGSPNAKKFPMPKLPEGFEWELCAIRGYGGWLRMIDTKWRPVFTDRSRSIPETPTAPTAPEKPVLYEL